ncbi:Increased rDNA silencing protein 4 [Nakaseomyces bracarensis]|uniref:Increased rDNA silencing protein 4 n=1 Tax=Nakaseomyces bracarensis TaxID=273131 RepID=A0ABR4NZ40_9SACH
MHMRLQKRRRNNHVQEQISELPAEAKNDSLRAAQVIFKRHAENSTPVQGNSAQNASQFIASSGDNNNNLTVNERSSSSNRRNSNNGISDHGPRPGSVLRNVNTSMSNQGGSISPGYNNNNNSNISNNNNNNSNSNSNSNNYSGISNVIRTSSPLIPPANVPSPANNSSSPIPIPNNKQPIKPPTSRSAISSPTSPSALQTATAAANVVAAKSLSRSLRAQPNQEKLRKGLESAHQAASVAATNTNSNIQNTPTFVPVINSPSSPMPSSYTEDHSHYFNTKAKTNDETNEETTSGGRSSSNTSNINRRTTPKESTTPTDRQPSPDNIDDIVNALKSIDIKEQMDRSKSASPALAINTGKVSTKETKIRKPKRTTSGRVRPPSPALVVEEPVPSVIREHSPAYSNKSLSIPTDAMTNEEYIDDELDKYDQNQGEFEYDNDSESFVDDASMSKTPISPPPDALSPSQIAAMTAASMASGSTLTLPADNDQASLTGSMSQYSNATITNKNGLPDILPNKRMGNKLRFRIFGKHGDRRRLNEAGSFDSRYSTNDDSSINKSSETNQNIKFKTTMRSKKYLGNDNISDDKKFDNIDDDYDDDDYDSAFEDNDNLAGHYDDIDLDNTNLRDSSTNNNSSATMSSSLTTNNNSFSNMNKNSSGNGTMSNLDYSLRDTGEEKKKRKRNLIKKTLKTTASVVPYYPHYALTHLASGVSNVNNLNNNNKNNRRFDEDKPWKSHKDVGFITEPERKRYEAMWVSNRYLYLNLLPWWPKDEVENEVDEVDSSITAPSAPCDSEEDEVTKLLLSLPNDGLMLNLVAKDIWERSNLPNDLLRQIYNMVDTRKDGTLNRESFLVGMWLVDQCLYGRKLPQEVDPKVWASVDKWVLNVVNSTMMTALEKKQKKKMMKRELKNIKKEQKQAVAEHS